MKTLIFAICLTPSLASGQSTTVVLEPVADNTLYESVAGDLSNGAGPTMFAGLSIIGEEKRALMRFDVAGAIPSGSVIQSVSLRLRVTRTIAQVPMPQSLHRVTADWGEAASPSTGGLSGGGAGGPAFTGDATWLHTFHPASTWTTPGGDFALPASATQMMPIDGDVDLTSTGMASDVQAWVDGTQMDFGWVLLDESTVTSARRYESREADTGRPTLTIQFDPPTSFGSIYCTTDANTSGAPATITATGSQIASANNLVLSATSLPAHQFGIFVTSMTAAAPTPTSNLCLGGSIGRFVGPSQILNAGPAGTFSLAVDLTAFPQGNMGIAVAPGETWRFQAWFRDLTPAGAEFSDAMEVTFF